jgi:hypothetical protein
LTKEQHEEQRHCRAAGMAIRKPATHQAACSEVVHSRLLKGDVGDARNQERKRRPPGGVPRLLRDPMMLRARV